MKCFSIGRIRVKCKFWGSTSEQKSLAQLSVTKFCVLWSFSLEEKKYSTLFIKGSIFICLYKYFVVLVMFMSFGKNTETDNILYSSPYPAVEENGK